jgi:hypothetical protein
MSRISPKMFPKLAKDETLCKKMLVEIEKILDIIHSPDVRQFQRENCTEEDQVLCTCEQDQVKLEPEEGMRYPDAAYIRDSSAALFVSAQTSLPADAATAPSPDGMLAGINTEVRPWSTPTPSAAQESEAVPSSATEGERLALI